MAQVAPGQVRAAGTSAPEEGRESNPLARKLLQGQETVIAVIGVALAIYFSVASSAFATTTNGATLSHYIAPTAILGLAEVMILILGEIDLSVGEVYVLAPFLVRYMSQDGLGVVGGIFVALVVACAIGFVNGLITVKLRVPSFITTLGTVFAIEGIILISSNGTQANTRGTGLLKTMMGGGTYSEIVWAILAVIVLHFVLRRTTFGLHTVAAGGNDLAAREAGVRVDAVKIWCFVLCSFMGALMGLLDSYRIGSLDPSTDGLTLMFYGVAAAVIGGTALTGGRGTMIGAFIGAIVLGILQDGFNIIGISSFEYDLILGLAILGAMILNIQLERLRVSRGRGGGSLARLLLRTNRRATAP